MWAFDVETVAVNAVMAGARPQYLPVIPALAATFSPPMIVMNPICARAFNDMGHTKNR
jgi:hypothetical protein